MKRFLTLFALLAAWPAFGATCKISEYQNIIADPNGRPVQVAQEPRLASQTVTYTTSAQSSAFNASTRFVRIICDAKAHFRFSTAGTNATANDPYLAVDVAEWFAVPVGQSYLVDFYDGSS